VLPWVRIDKQYTFDTYNGPKTLADLFAGPLAAADLPRHVRPGLDRHLPGMHNCRLP
jgi:Bacterial protein of unknown function (DUF899)